MFISYCSYFVVIKLTLPRVYFLINFVIDESSTFTTLKNLKKRGVKVNLGFPDEMWDTPDAEIVLLKKQVGEQ